MAVIGQKVDGKRQWVYPADVKGKFQKIHRWSGALLMAHLVIVPWFNYGGVPLARIDIAGRRLYSLGSTFTPRDTVFLVLILLFGSFAAFFFTSIFGRLWCGFTCPQTVFLEEIIRPIENWIEGSRGKRMKRDKGPWTFDKAWRKGVKWTLFAVVSLALGMTIVSWFADPRQVWTLSAGTATTAMTLVVAGALFVDFAWFREQFCNFLCPYARFQGALTDEHSWVVGYDVAQSEPRRGSVPKGEPTGACIDCNKCVAVCPAGIDIRDGYQLECINCARCVDACQGVMLKIGREQSLVRLSTEAEFDGKESKLIRPRTLVYAGLLCVIALGFILLLAGRHPLDATVSRLPGTLFVIDDEGWVRNTFMLQVTNNHGAPGDDPSVVQLELSGLEGAELMVAPISVAPGQSLQIPVVVRAPPESGGVSTTALRFDLTTNFDKITLETTFKGGVVK